MVHTKKIYWLWILAGLTITAWLMFVVSADEIGGTLSNGIDQWLSVSLPCTPASVSHGSVNTTTCAITCGAWYDKSGNSCIVHQSGGWGGGWAPVIPACSLSHLVCTDGTYVKKSGVSCEWGSLGNACNVATWSLENTWSTTPPPVEWGWTITGSPFSPELNDAYLYAYHLWITTIPTILKADLEWVLIRSHMAKMMVNYAIKVLNKQPDLTLSCNFNDIGNETVELQWYIKLACQLGLMWYASDGVTQNASFYPERIVDRAQFGTVLSRLLRGTLYAGGEPFYSHHLEALKNNNIMTNIDNPLASELRGRVMLMLMRADK